MTTLTTPAAATAPGAAAPPLEAGTRPRPGAAARHTFTLAWRNLVKLRRQPEQLMDLTLQPVIFIVMFVYLFGGAVEGSTHDYLQYVLPGILVQTVVMATMGTGIGLATDMSTGVFDRFRSLPISRAVPLAGNVLGDVARFFVGIAVVFAFGCAIGFRVRTGPLEVLAAVALLQVFAFAMCWIAALVGTAIRNPRTVQGVGFIVMFPLTFGSDMFARTETMPGWLQAWVKVNPITELTDAVRGLLVEGPVAGPATVALLWAAGILAVFAPLAVAAYRRKA